MLGLRMRFHGPLTLTPVFAQLRFGQALPGEGSVDLLGPRERELYAGLRDGARRAAFLAGRLAAHRALAQLDGGAGVVEVLPGGVGEPRVRGGIAPAGVSITRGERAAYAVAGPACGLGLDVCDLSAAPRLLDLARRHLAEERELCTTPTAHVTCWAIKEAGLKALGLGLLDGGLVDAAPPLRVVSLDPPRMEPAHLVPAMASVPGGVLVVVAVVTPWR